jgi:hypothetical protein
MNEYEQGFYDARDSVLSLIDEFYVAHEETLKWMSPRTVLEFLKLAIKTADIEEVEE